MFDDSLPSPCPCVSYPCLSSNATIHLPTFAAFSTRRAPCLAPSKARPLRRCLARRRRATGARRRRDRLLSPLERLFAKLFLALLLVARVFALATAAAAFRRRPTTRLLRRLAAARCTCRRLTDTICGAWPNEFGQIKNTSPTQHHPLTFDFAQIRLVHHCGAPPLRAPTA